METIKYGLKSKPGVSVEVPADYAKKAERLVSLAVESPQKIWGELNDHPYIRNPGILSGTTELSGNPESSRLQDALYLRVCMWGSEKEFQGSEKERSIQNGLVRIIRNVESSTN